MLDSVTNSDQNSQLFLCPHCGYPAKIIGKNVIENRIEAITYECKNCHRFSKAIMLGEPDN